MTGDAEAERIRREYARRAEAIPAGFYDLDKPANYFAHCQIARRSISLLERNGLLPLAGRKIADIGCGAGNWMLEFIQWGAIPEDLFGIDLNSPRIEEARKRVPGASLETGDASALPLPDSSVDLACQFTAFSSVLDASVKRTMAAEMLRIVRQRGAILWYDLCVANPSNSAVRAIGQGELRRLFPRCRFDVERMTLAPPIARAIVPRSWILGSVLERVPMLCSHYLALIRKAA
jgi:ubiquinone/menaquinone biosynthesis C-methylase UbiE